MKQFLLSFSLTLAIAAGVYAWRSAHVVIEGGPVLPEAAQSAKSGDSAAQQTPEPKPDFSLKFTAISAQMNRISNDPKLEKKETDTFAEQLSAADAITLRDIALSKSAKNPERFTAVFLLAKRADFFAELAAVATSVPSESSKHRDFERVLRMEALEGMESQFPDPDKLAEAFAKARENNKEPFLRQLAAIGEDGARKHRPLVKNFLDAKVHGASHAR
jgi:hypothetical protein